MELRGSHPASSVYDAHCWRLLLRMHNQPAGGFVWQSRDCSAQKSACRITLRVRHTQLLSHIQLVHELNYLRSTSELERDAYICWSSMRNDGEHARASSKIGKLEFEQLRQRVYEPTLSIAFQNNSAHLHSYLWIRFGCTILGWNSARSFKLKKIGTMAAPPMRMHTMNVIAGPFPAVSGQ
jgi:hypothetical protein